jgi:5-methylcytosine-specific restriction enzyme A
MPKMPPTHRPPRPGPSDARPSAARRGYGGAWRKLRRAKLARDPFCEVCGAAVATCVDHDRSLATGGTHDEANLVSMCAPCHNRKGVARDGLLGRPKR